MRGARMGAVEVMAAERGQRLVAEQWVPSRLHDVFAFFSEAKNLERLTPAFLRFRILDMSTPAIEAGSLIRYRLRLHGVPVSWTTRIDTWEPPRAFVDLQLSGPYRRWHHTHTFDEVDGGTLIRDRVDYELPFPTLIAWTPIPAFVERDVSNIFRYRQRVVAELMGGG